LGLTSVSLSPHFLATGVRHTPESVCGMPRNHCATYPGITVRHGADFAELLSRHSSWSERWEMARKNILFQRSLKMKKRLFVLPKGVS